jgi:hypothetical protein
MTPCTTHLSRRHLLAGGGTLLGMSMVPGAAAAPLMSGVEPVAEGQTQIRLTAFGVFNQNVALFVESGPVSTIAWAHSMRGGSGANSVFAAPTSGNRLRVTVDAEETSVTHRLKHGHRHELDVFGGTIIIDLRDAT